MTREVPDISEKDKLSCNIVVFSQILSALLIDGVSEQFISSPVMLPNWGKKKKRIPALRLHLIFMLFLATE